MPVSHSTPRAKTLRPLAELQSRARDLVAAVRDSVVEHVLHSPSTSGITSAAPPDVGIRLVEVLHAAQAAGHTRDDLTAVLSDEDRLVFEMVVGMYDTACLTPLPVLLESVGRLRQALA
jgi:hypothetical protein